LTTENKLLLYKAIIKPIWYYGIQLWGCAKPSNTQIIQRIQSKTLRIVFNAPWNVSNKTLHKDSRIPLVEDEIIKITNRYFLNLTGHSNEQVNQLHVHPEGRRRLHRQWPTDVLQYLLGSVLLLGELSLDSISSRSACVQTIYLELT
jgi:hypothetical protein